MLEVKPISKIRSLLDWHQDRGIIEMEPSYQRRGDLWPEKNKQLLINSILNRYDIPKIYLADFTYSDTPLKESKKPYAIIDGKQRFTIFFDFFDDKIKLDSTPVYFDNKEFVLAGLKYSDLQVKHFPIAKVFEDYVPTIMSVISDDLSDVQELFIRLNLNVSISGAERRNAMPGPLPAIIRKLSVHSFFRDYATFPINRGQDLNAAAKFLLMQEAHGFANVKRVDLDRFVKNNKDKSPFDYEGISIEISSILDKMTQVFEKKDVLLKSQAQLTVYYWLVNNYSALFGKQIRNFLLAFEQKRAQVRREAAARAKGIDLPISDPNILEYNLYVRTPDDRSKQQSMYNQLSTRLENYPV